MSHCRARLAGLSFSTLRPTLDIQRLSSLLFAPQDQITELSKRSLGITHMFGGFSQDFYNAYHDVLPKADPVQHYDARIKLYELYHHLNHVLGSHLHPLKSLTLLSSDFALWCE